MSRPVSLAAAALGLLAGMGCWLGGTLAARALPSHPGEFRFQYREAVEVDAATMALLEEEHSYVLARQTGDMEGEARLFGRTEQLTLLEALGDPSLLLEKELSMGSWPDLPGQCVVDGATARTLWGEGALDQLLYLDDKEYRVTGIVEAGEPLAVVLHSGAEKFFPGFGAYRAEDGAAYPRQELDAFFNRVNIPRPGSVLQLGTAAELFHQLALLPLWLPLVAAARWCAGGLLPGPRLRKWRRAAVVAALALCWKLVGFQLPLSRDWLPGRWSNFSFWSGKWRDLADQAAVLWTSAGSLPSYLLGKEAYLPVLLWTLGALVLLWMALRRLPLAQKPPPPPPLVLEEWAA